MAGTTPAVTQGLSQPDAVGVRATLQRSSWCSVAAQSPV